MHSAGLELTKLIYTRLEDNNLIRHRGDRLYKALTLAWLSLLLLLLAEVSVAHS